MEGVKEETGKKGSRKGFIRRRRSGGARGKAGIEFFNDEGEDLRDLRGQEGIRGDGREEEVVGLLSKKSSKLLESYKTGEYLQNEI